jgi:hypothetical protein
MSVVLLQVLSYCEFVLSYRKCFPTMIHECCLTANFALQQVLFYCMCCPLAGQSVYWHRNRNKKKMRLLALAFLSTPPLEVFICYPFLMYVSPPKISNPSLVAYFYENRLFLLKMGHFDTSGNLSYGNLHFPHVELLNIQTRGSPNP